MAFKKEVTISATGTWAEVTELTDDTMYSFQNTGICRVYFYIGAAAPTSESPVNSPNYLGQGQQGIVKYNGTTDKVFLRTDVGYTGKVIVNG